MRLEKELVGCEMQLARRDDEQTQWVERQRLIETDRRHIIEERTGLERKEAEARDSILRFEAETEVG